MTAYNLKNKQILRKSVFTLIAFCLSLSLPGLSFAFFSEIETSHNNTFGASSLGIALSVTEQTNDSRTVTVLADHAENVEYQVSKTSTAGVFCTEVQVEIIKDGAEIYDGSLTAFSQSTSSVLMSGESDAFEYLLSVADDNATYIGDCTITFSYKANQTGYTHGQAFFDTEVDTFLLRGSDFSATPSIPTGVVLNEVLANPEGADTQGGLQGEWIELYNNGSVAVDLTGWYIKDLAGNTITISPATTMNGRTTIGADGSGLQWVVVYMNGQVLNNTGDTVTLYNSSNVALDSYAFGNHGTDADQDSNNTGGGDNDDPSGDETAGNEGKSDARIPDGTGAWIDPIPTPGGYNVLEEEPQPTQQTVPLDNSFTFSSELSKTETVTPAEEVTSSEATSEDVKESEKQEEGPVEPEVTEEEQKEEVKEEQQKEEPVQESEPEKMRPEEPSMEAIEPTQTEIE